MKIVSLNLKFPSLRRVYKSCLKAPANTILLRLVGKTPFYDHSKIFHSSLIFETLAFKKFGAIQILKGDIFVSKLYKQIIKQI